MGKKVIGKCALCKKEDMRLLDSHIIPKLVYKRIKEYPNSRFRNVFQLKDIYQDGEKKPLLCEDCEKFFNGFETPYVNTILDPYLKDKKAKHENNDLVNNYIYAMNWRVIYDDLYNRDSFTKGTRSVFEDFENIIWKHLDNIRNEKVVITQIPNIRNYTFHIDEFNFKKPVKELFKSGVFGYCFTNEYNNYFIVSYYLGLVYVTEFKPLLIQQDISLLKLIKLSAGRKQIKKRVKEEILHQALSTAQQMKSNEDILKNGLREDIKRRYKRK